MTALLQLLVMGTTMSEEQARALFLLANIPIIGLHRLENKYWPDVAQYASIRRDSPWWLATTPWGAIQIGWLKRVISISWEETHVRKIITPDDLTKDERMVHAYTLVKALEYLTSLSSLLRIKPEQGPSQ
jgi:hypothetical protein